MSVCVCVCTCIHVCMRLLVNICVYACGYMCVNIWHLNIRVQGLRYFTAVSNKPGEFAPAYKKQ